MKYQICATNNQETLAKLFQPYYQEVDGTLSQTKGTGLGMPITRELVELMDGTIQVNSTPEKGTLVEVQLKLGKLNGRDHEGDVQ